MTPTHKSVRHWSWSSWLGLVALLLLILGACGYVAPRWDEVQALGADWLRTILGDRAVSQMEVVLFKMEDDLRLAEYSLGLGSPVAPWTPGPLAVGVAVTTATPGLSHAPAPTPVPSLTAPSTPTLPTGTPPEATVTPVDWPLAASSPLGHLAGEGKWSAYLVAADGTVFAERAFFQPDPIRPYVVAAVVAFNLQSTRLHYVVGTQEPESSVPFVRSGEIAPSDKVPGILLAAFNGGFRGSHGNFGVMVDGTTLLPPREGMGTVAIDEDGAVRIDQWGRFPLGPGIASWRQNGPLILDSGQVNPQVDLVSYNLWGTLLTGKTLTWRSGLGLSRDGQVLYYAAGPSLSVRGLAATLGAAGARNALELDINNFWVEFVSIRAVGGRFFAYALFPEMSEGEGRYLGQSARDFFYITTSQG